MARKRTKAEASGFSILVVDDQEETLISSRLLLEREGHRVVTALDGFEALTIFHADQFDLVIVDYFMPRMSGEEVVRSIRNVDSNVQIILQTGYSGEKPPREMLKLLDIQGYHDKSEGPDRMLLWVDVALKAARHLHAIHSHESELVESRAQLRSLSARLLTAQEDERERISRELHDQLGQLLTAIGLDVDWALSHCGPEEIAARKDRLKEAGALVRQAIAETRELCATLRPGELRGNRLLAEIRSHAAEFARRAGLALRLNCNADVDLPEQYGRNIYRIAQEALSNISRHASASEVTLDISMIGEKFLMTISDNGIGFDPVQVSDSHAVGLIGMRERAHLIGAKLEVTSESGRGTSVRVELPLVHSA